ncbi:MAG: hypothetical protein AABX44_02035 [Nanoarchaeota archaeon]
MAELITKNIVIGGIVIIINLIPLLTKKYKLIPITALISLVLILIGNFIK